MGGDTKQGGYDETGGPFRGTKQGFGRYKQGTKQGFGPKQRPGNSQLLLQYTADETSGRVSAVARACFCDCAVW
jgi:hypothetical protein